MERSLQHSILKECWRFKHCDLAREALAHAEMTRFPSHGFSQADQPGHDAADCFFFGSFGRLHVQVDATRKVEAAADWRLDERLDSNRLHAELS
jgi:hypothetical protein